MAESTQDFQKFMEEMRDWRQGKPPPMDLTDESIPVAERQTEAIRQGDMQAELALGVEMAQGAHARDETITLVREDGTDIRDEIARLEAEGDTEQAQQLGYQLAQAQLDQQYEDARQGLWDGLGDLADRGLGGQNAPEPPEQPERNAEDLYPHNQLSDAIKTYGHSLGQDWVDKTRRKILEAEQERQLGPQGTTRERYRAAEAAGDVQGMLSAGAQEMIQLMADADVQGNKKAVGPQDQPAPQPAPPEWTPKRVGG